MGWPSSHENDMGVDKWSDKMTTVVHIGYQIPIVKNLRFIPVIGYAKIAYGTTDGSDYTISDSGIVHNKFQRKKCFGARFWRDSGHKYKKSKYKFGFYKIFYFRWDCARILILNVLS